MFYAEGMSGKHQIQTKASLSLKLGDWLEAHATGWGIAAIPIVVGIVVLAALSRLWLA